MTKSLIIIGMNASGCTVNRMVLPSRSDRLLDDIAFERACAIDCGAVRVVIDIGE